MSTTATRPREEYKEPTYSHWRRPRSSGVFGQGLIGSVILVTCVLVTITTAALAGIQAGIAVGVVCMCLVPLVLRPQPYSKPLGQILLGKVAWWLRGRRGETIAVGGQLSAVPGGTYRLPGLLAPIEAYEFSTTAGWTFGLLFNRRAATWTILLRAQPEGSELVDEEVLDERVAGWARYLADATRIGDLSAITVTVETVPDAGARLQAEVARLIKPSTPQIAREALHEAAAIMPTGQAVILARVAISWKTGIRAQKAKRQDRPRVMAESIGQHLPGILASLGASGGGLCRPMALREIAESARAAYDPAIWPSLEQARISGRGSTVTWENAGPTAAVSRRGHLWHDGHASVSWAMENAPMGVITRGALVPLLAPDADAMRKRVTLLYRPFRTQDARVVARRDIKDVTFERGKHAVGDAHEDVELLAARKTQEELAQGAGLVRFSLIVTATVKDSGDLDQIAANVEAAGASADIQLRRDWLGQSALFAMGLGFGLIPTAHSSVPPFIRDTF